ncbi:MAG TPA: aminotransferase class III-fold pyridoxal phosphate-dependent enzyme [Candidatus Methylomirabilis sp.]|nr:aminotransferase class III-fold pyridoxal phosphate-dependent enzyme [Candidatus Methylomirabilis sp.]
MMPEARVAQPVAEAEAERLARELYGLDARAARLPGEYDDNFHLAGSDGRAFVLRIMHPARERSFVEMQCAALQHLARRAAPLPLPRVCPTPDGDFFAQVKVADETPRFAWLLTYLPGTVLAKVHPHTADLLKDLGRFLGAMDAALSDFSHPAAQRDLKWDLARAVWIRNYLNHISDPARRTLVEEFLSQYESQVVPGLPSLRRSVIYGDANDYNVLVSPPWPQPRKITGVVDFGDMHHTVMVSELAIAAAYAILGKDDPLQAAAQVAAGYHGAMPLTDAELAVLYPLIGMRLAVSVTNSAHRKTLLTDDPYVTISEGPAWEALEKWAKVPPRFAHYMFREACGLAPVPQCEKVCHWLASQSQTAASILETDLRRSPCVVFDLSAGSAFLGADPKAAETANLADTIFREMKRAGVSVGVGRYDEARLLYSSSLFGSGTNATDERRTIHLGVDLFATPGTPIRAPIDGVVHKLAINTAPLDYGPVVILRHETADRTEFFTLYGHLSRESFDLLQPGQRIARGQAFARIGGVHENGGWAPHLHFQIILDLLDLGSDFPGVARASERAVWTSLSPDPNLLLGIPADRFPQAPLDATRTLEARHRLLGKNLSVSYDSPLKIVRGWMQYLYDDAGRAYLDVYNNVPLVGHSHPRVVRAVQEQLALLNSNTRYLHDNVNRYAERLTQLLPEPLRVCYFLNSGSEANELALRLARAHTGREDVIVLEHAYHGHTNTLIDISAYKFNGPGGRGRKPWVHVAPIPDDYRGPYRREDANAGAKYAQHVAEILEDMHKDNRGVAAFLAETLPSVAGQIVFPRGYLAEAYKNVRAAGGVCIADEVQVGFGRLGTHFWGVETQGVAPDIVVLGKPIGNAFPLAAVVTTREVAVSFDNGMEFFSTFGGNPVACAAGLAVLDVLRDEQLQQNALRIGNYLMARFKSLQERHALIGDVRGSGLFLGVDLVLHRETREPAPAQASYVVNRLRERGILTGTDGPHHNVIKLRPPLIFSQADADLFATTLDAVLGEDPAQANT